MAFVVFILAVLPLSYFVTLAFQLSFHRCVPECRHFQWQAITFFKSDTTAFLQGKCMCVTLLLLAVA